MGRKNFSKEMTHFSLLLSLFISFLLIFLHFVLQAFFQTLLFALLFSQPLLLVGRKAWRVMIISHKNNDDCPSVCPPLGENPSLNHSSWWKKIQWFMKIFNLFSNNSWSFSNFNWYSYNEVEAKFYQMCFEV